MLNDKSRQHCTTHHYMFNLKDGTLMQAHACDDRSGTLFSVTALVLKEHRNDISSQDKHVTIDQIFTDWTVANLMLLQVVSRWGRSLLVLHPKVEAGSWPYVLSLYIVLWVQQYSSVPEYSHGIMATTIYTNILHPHVQKWVKVKCLSWSVCHTRSLIWDSNPF